MAHEISTVRENSKLHSENLHNLDHYRFSVNVSIYDQFMDSKYDFWEYHLI